MGSEMQSQIMRAQGILPKLIPSRVNQNDRGVNLKKFIFVLYGTTYSGNRFISKL
jgi:hypothetical protein